MSTPSPASSALDRFRQGIEQISKAANIIALVLVALMVLLTVADVTGRYLFSQPIIGALELTEFMMAMVVFLGLAYTQVNKGHTSVTVLVNKLSPATRTSLRFATGMFSLGLLALMVRQSFVQTLDYLKGGIISTILEVSIVPFFSVAVVGLLLLGLVVLADLLDDVRKMEGGRRRGILLLPGFLVFLLVVAMIIWQPQLPQVGLTLSGLLGVVLLLILIFSGIPVAYALALTGFLGMTYLLGTTPAFEVLTKRPYLTAASYTLSVVPLFVLMGYFCLYSQIGKDVYYSLHKWLGHLPGGLAIATVGGCAAFAAVTGSSIACAVAIGVIALPEMARYKYSPSLATGTVAAGGTLGILIPPSITFIVYGVLTEQSIGKLFIAGILPGIMLALMFMTYIYIHARYKPAVAPRGPTASLREKVVSLKTSWPILVLFVLVVGGLYAGIFSPTEAGGIGAFSALIIGLALRRFTLRGLVDSLLKTVDTTAMILFMFIGAEILGLFFAQSRLPFMLADLALTLPVPSYVVVIFFSLIILFLGCIMPTLPVVILLVPMMFPAIVALGYDLIWFGVIIVLLVEMGLITPPVGLNVYAIAGVAKDVPMQTIFKGIMPFVALLLIGEAILLAFPQIALFLPNLIR